MREAVLLAWKDCFVRFQYRITIVFVIVLPIAMTLISGLAFQGFEPKNIRTSLGLVDEDGGAIAERFLTEFARAAEKKSTGTADDQSGADIRFETGLSLAEARKRVDGKLLGAAIVLPKGLTESMNSSQPLKVSLLVRPDRTVERAVLETTADRLVRIAAQKDPLPLDWQPEEQTKVGARGFNSFTQAVTGNGMMFILMNCIVNGGMALVREKRQNTLARLLISPMSPRMIIFGKTLGVYAVGVIQALVIFGFGLVVGVRPPMAAVPGLVLITGLVILVGSALGLFISAIARREETVEAVGAPVSLVLTALGGGMFPVEMGPAWMKTTSLFLPTGWAMDGYHKLLWDGLGSFSVLPHALVLAGFAAVFLWVGVRKLRWE